MNAWIINPGIVYRDLLLNRKCVCSISNSRNDSFMIFEILLGWIRVFIADCFMYACFSIVIIACRDS